MKFLLLLLLVPAVVFSCKYKGEKKGNGETWIVRSTFLMKCTIEKNGSWHTEVVGCKTESGVEVPIGQTVKDGETQFSCSIEGNGKVEIRKDIDPVHACDGHSVGESWISNKNFNKTCHADGARISNCVTDTGLTVELNSKQHLSGIIYTCNQQSNGTVTIHREGVPVSKETGKDIVKENVNRQPVVNNAQTVKPTLVTAAVVRVEKPYTTQSETIEIVAPTTAPTTLTCNEDGAIRKPEETWVAEKKFTKKCTPEGSTVILNCLIDENTTINVGSELKIGNKLHKCWREGKRVFYEQADETSSKKKL